MTFGCGVFGVPIGENVDIFWSKQQKPINDIASLKDRYTYHEHTKTLIIHKTGMYIVVAKLLTNYYNNKTDLLNTC